MQIIAEATALKELPGAGKVLLSPVRGALPTNLELQYYSREDERSNRTTGSTKGFSLVLAFHNPRAVATVASFLPPKRLLPPAYLPTYLFRARILQ